MVEILDKQMNSLRQEIREILKEFGWDYTRTWRTHYINDGKLYKDKHLIVIRDATPYGEVRQYKYGYDLYVKGKFIKNAKTVKELKLLVEEK